MTTPLPDRPAHELVRMLADGDVSSVDVVRAHLDRIAERDSTIHAFVEVLGDRALADARRADEARARGESLGPLHGLPISVKESLEFAGSAQTLGLVRRKDARASADAVVVRAAREAGAIVLGRTNVAQTLMMSESRNPIFGQTANPWSLAHAAGGSSGGEGAAVAAGMSCLGIGTDIGGSIRGPAHFCGVVGFKPTLDRWSNRGSVGIFRGQEAVRSQCGPMARTTADIVLALRSLDTRAMSARDPQVPPLPWTDPRQVDVRSLRVGFYVNDGVLEPSKAVVRAVRRAVDALRAAGVEAVELTLPGLEDAIYSYPGLLAADGGRTFVEALTGEEPDVALATFARLASIPDALRGAISRGMAITGERRAARIAGGMRTRTVAEYWKMVWRLRSWRLEVLETMAEARVDALVCPPYATPAMPHGLSAEFVLAAAYTFVFNMLQLPAGVVPVTRVRANETTRAEPRDKTDRRAVEVDRSSEGLPVGAQIVSLPWKDEVALALMQEVESAVRSDPEFPTTPV